MTTFSYTEDAGISKKTKPRISVIKFDDGYEQRQGRGINLVPRSWALSFILRTNTVADAIETFFEDHYGVVSFSWTPTGESTPILVKCADWDRVYEKGLLSTITATFEEVFDPA